MLQYYFRIAEEGLVMRPAERVWLGLIDHQKDPNPDNPIFPYVRLAEDDGLELHASIVAGEPWDALSIAQLGNDSPYHIVHRISVGSPGYTTILLMSDLRQRRLVVDEEAIAALHELLDPCDIRWRFIGQNDKAVQNLGLLGIAEVTPGRRPLAVELGEGLGITSPIPDIEIVAGGLRAVVGHAIAHELDPPLGA